MLYNAKSKTGNELQDEICTKEAEYIHKINPILNRRIPDVKDWHKFEDRELDAPAILKELL